MPQIKYLHLLVQEFAVQIDQGFLNAVLTLVTNEAEQKPYTVRILPVQCSIVCSSLILFTKFDSFLIRRIQMVKLQFIFAKRGRFGGINV